MSNAELAVSYASLILADDEVDITVSILRLYLISLLCSIIYCSPRIMHAFDGCSSLFRADNITQADKLQTLLKAANITDVEPIWTTLFSKVRKQHRSASYIISLN